MKTLFKSVAIITVFSVITRALGLLLKIYISRVIGAEALGVYQVAMSVFSLLCTVIASGLPLIISKNVADRPKETGRIVYAGMVISMTICVAVCATIFIFPNFFDSIFKQSKSTTVLKYLVPGIIGTAAYASFRGALWGKKEFFVLGLIELIEQIIRIVFCVLIFNLAFVTMYGENIAGLSLSIACVVSSIIAIVIYFSNGGRLSFKKSAIKPLLKQSSPITLVRTLSSVVGLVIALLIPLRLMHGGISHNEALAQFGVATGMVMPLITISGTLISSLSTALIPEISDTKNKRANYQINTAISISIIVSALLIPTFLAVGKPLGLWLFKNELAGELLTVGSFIIIPMGISQITSSVLNAIGLEVKSLWNYAAGAVALILCILFLPKYIGIYSLVLGMGLLSLITSILNLLMIRKMLSLGPLKTLLSSLVLCLPCAVGGRWTFNILSRFFSNFFAIFLTAGLCMVALFLLMRVFNVVGIETITVKRSKTKKQKLQLRDSLSIK